MATQSDRPTLAAMSSDCGPSDVPQPGRRPRPGVAYLCAKLSARRPPLRVSNDSNKTRASRDLSCSRGRHAPSHARQASVRLTWSNVKECRMATNILRLAHAFRQACQGASKAISHGHSEQLVAAALGYKSLASYQAAISSGTEPAAIDKAEHVVFNATLFEARVAELGLVAGGGLLSLLVAAAQPVVTGARLHRSASAFESYVQEELDDDAANGGVTSGPMAETNPDGIDEIYIPLELDFDAAPIGMSQRIEIEGHVNMGIDTERPYSGHHIDVHASVTFSRIGRALVTEFAAAVDEASLDGNW